MRLFNAVCLLFIFCAVSSAQDMESYAITFNGKWEPANDPTLIDGYGFQDIQNMRKDQQGLIGVKGHTPINTSAWNSTNKYPKNAFQFKKETPSESHLFVYATNSSGTSKAVYKNDTAIPDQGNFSGTVWHTGLSGSELGRFSMGSQGTVIYTDGQESIIWPGDEVYPLGFKVYDPLDSFNYDFTRAVSNDLTDSNNIATIYSADAEIDSNTILMLHMDGADGSTTFTDSSPSGQTVTANGDAQLDTSAYAFGTASGLFDDTGDYLSVPDSSEWNWGTSAFTIDMQVYLPLVVLGVYPERSILKMSSGATNYFEISMYGEEIFGVNYYIRLLKVVDNVTVLNQSIKVGGALANDTWYHIALTREDSNTFSTYLDGTLQGSKTISDDVLDYTDDIILFNEFEGHVDEVRITKGVSLYSSNFDPPTSAYKDTGKAYMYLGSQYKIYSFDISIASPNSLDSDMSVYYYNGTSWSSVSGLSDGTSSGVTTLYQSGTVSFDDTKDLAKKKTINELELYWYKIDISKVDVSTTISTIILNANPQDISNIWDGTYTTSAAVFLNDDDSYDDYTAEAQDDNTLTVVEIDNGEGVLFIGSDRRLQGFNFKIPSDKNNTEDSTMSVSYWSGAAWITPTNISDSTNVDGQSLNKSGSITFDYVEKGEEFQRSLASDAELYYYRVSWSNALDSETEVYLIQGIPINDEIEAYSFPAFYGNRTLLIGNKTKGMNSALYSNENAPYIYNGFDSGTLFFGTDSAIIATANLYNVFNSTGYDQLIVAKENETYRLFGADPDEWIIQQMSTNIGCISPLSMTVCEVSGLEEGERHVAIWQGSSGIYMCDGASIFLISEDIRNYWDPDDDAYIPVARQTESVGWFDPDIMAYKLLISSGGGQTTHNIELEYSLKYGEWTKIYRENATGSNPLQIGFPVKTDNGKRYTYGATNEGIVYRLENGTTWNGTGIDQYVWTKNHMLNEIFPLMKNTIIKYTRFMFKNKSSATESMSIQHYGDDVLTVSGTNMQRPPGEIAINSGPFDTQSCILGPYLTHSFKISSEISSIADGMELQGLGLYFESRDSIYDN